MEIRIGDHFTIEGVRVKRPWWKFWIKPESMPLQRYVVADTVTASSITAADWEAFWFAPPPKWWQRLLAWLDEISA